MTEFFPAGCSILQRALSRKKSTSVGRSTLQRAAHRERLVRPFHFKINQTKYKNLIENMKYIKSSRIHCDIVDENTKFG
jgi:hypothetical protein